MRVREFMSDNGYYVNYTDQAAASNLSMPLGAPRDCLNRIAQCTLGIQQCRQALVQRGEPRFLVQRQPEQIAIRHLIMSHEPALKVADGVLEWQIVCPKTMHWMVNVKR